MPNLNNLPLNNFGPEGDRIALPRLKGHNISSTSNPDSSSIFPEKKGSERVDGFTIDGKGVRHEYTYEFDEDGMPHNFKSKPAEEDDKTTKDEQKTEDKQPVKKHSSHHKHVNKAPSNECMHRVKKGETLWKVAANNLKSDGKSASNKEIMAEMNRLAKLNGYDSYKDFNHDFFGKGSGKEFLIKDESLCQETKTDNTQKTQDTTTSTNEAPKEIMPRKLKGGIKMYQLGPYGGAVELQDNPSSARNKTVTSSATAPEGVVSSMPDSGENLVSKMPDGIDCNNVSSEYCPSDNTKLDSQAAPKSAFDTFVANNDQKHYLLETDDNGNKTVSYKGADGKNHKRIYDNNGTLRYEEQTHSTHRKSLPCIGHSTIEEHDTFFTQKTKYDADGNKVSDDLYSTDNEYHGRKMFGKTSRPTKVRHRHTNLMNNK